MKQHLLPVLISLLLGFGGSVASVAAPLAPNGATAEERLSLAHQAAGLAFPSKFRLDSEKLTLASANVLVLDAELGIPVYAKNPNEVTPIASVTKLMTAMVVLDGTPLLDEMLTVGIADIDLLKGSHSRLRLGGELSRREMLKLALMASENRAASALARHYPGGASAFVAAMNAKAHSLGMTRTRFTDSTGLSSQNVSTAYDLAKMVRAAANYPIIREFTTAPSHFVEVQPTGQMIGFNNTNSLVRGSEWDIQVSKTGFIREAGKCLVMMATIASRPVVIVLLDSFGQFTRIGDANRVKHWLETGESLPIVQAVKNVAAKVKRSKGLSLVKGTFAPRPVKAQKRRRM